MDKWGGRGENLAQFRLKCPVRIKKAVVLFAAAWVRQEGLEDCGFVNVLVDEKRKEIAFQFSRSLTNEAMYVFKKRQGKNAGTFNSAYLIASLNTQRRLVEFGYPMSISLPLIAEKITTPNGQTTTYVLGKRAEYGL